MSGVERIRAGVTGGNRLLGRFRAGSATGDLLVAGAALALLTGANLLNNIVAPAAYVLTSVGVSGLLLLLARLTGLTWADLGLARQQAGRGLNWAVVLTLGVALVYALALLVPATRGLFQDERIARANSGEVLYMALLRVPLGTVLLEEVAFRGVVYGWAARRWGPWQAVVVSSALFGLWHILPARGIEKVNSTLRAEAAGLEMSAQSLSVLSIVAAVLAAAVAGAFLCELRRRSRSLLAPAGMHLATNVLGVLVAAAVIGIR